MYTSARNNIQIPECQSHSYKMTVFYRLLFIDQENVLFLPFLDLVYFTEYNDFKLYPCNCKAKDLFSFVIFCQFI